MAKKNDAKRASKKHAKEKKRQKKLAARPRPAPEVDVLAQWKPGLHGIEGLARLLRTDSHDASVLAEHMAKGGRKDAKAAWIPSRVRAFSTEALLTELATRGVTTDEAAFVAAAESYESSREFAWEQWGALLAPGASVHDRDLVGEAAEVLWERWIPARINDEQLRDRYRDAEDVVENEGPDAGCELILALLEETLPTGGLARLTRAGIDPRPALEQLGYSVQLADSSFARVGRLYDALHERLGTPPDALEAEALAALERGIAALGDGDASAVPDDEADDEDAPVPT